MSEQEITARVVVAALLVVAVGGLGVYETGNTEAYEPRHAAPED